MFEIEQKFVYEEIPDIILEKCNRVVIYRQYLSVNPEIRINRKVYDDGKERFALAIKSDDFLKRYEYIQILSEDEYYNIASINGGKDLIIDVYEYPIDDYHQIQFKKCVGTGIQFAELSYKDSDDYDVMQRNIVQFEFLKEDVTYNEKYYVKNIWKEYNEM